MTRAIKLILCGALGALGILRGAELLIVAHAAGPAILPMALGILFAALFVREFRKPVGVKQN
jgi:hypothetical protein